VVDTDHGTSKSSSFTQSVKDDETGVKSPYDLIRRVFSFRLPATYEGWKKTGQDKDTGQDAYVTFPMSAMTARLESRIRGWPYSSLHRLPECRALLEAAGPGRGLLEATHFRRVTNDEEGAPWEVQVRQLILATDGIKVPRALPDEALAPKYHVVIPRPRRRLVVSAVARTLRHPRPPIGRSSAGRRSRSCASPRQRPATIGRLRLRIDGLVAAPKRAGAVCWLTNDPDAAARDAFMTRAGGAADDDPLGQGPGVPGGDPDDAGPVAERAPAGRGGRQ
jgi:hypothetical protein